MLPTEIQTPQLNQEDYAFMQRAIQLARRGIGHTSPNPAVGAVVVRDGAIVGEGYHHAAGQPHAEIEALRAAGNASHDATVYVTLEPCSHYGRTPPCADALIAAGVSRVVYAVGDPNPKVNGRGAQRLRNAGIVVDTRVCEAEAYALNQPFFKHVQTGLPYVTAKFAVSLDGKIATRLGDSQWITNPEARRQGHLLRQASDVILVGANTALLDNPRLTTRHPDIDEPSHPVRVVVDSHGRVPADAHLYSPNLVGKTILATVSASEKHCLKLASQGVEVWHLPANTEGRVKLNALFSKLGAEKYQSVMVEGGGTLLGALLDQELIDRVWAFVAPLIIGGDGAPNVFKGRGVGSLAEALKLINLDVSMLGDNIWIQGDVEKEVVRAAVANSQPVHLSLSEGD